MDNMYGIVGGVYSRRLRDELVKMDPTLNITRTWIDVDELMKELATSQSFVDELHTLLILDASLESLGTDNKREKKLLVLQNELALNKSDIKLKVLTRNSFVASEIRSKMANVHNRLYVNLEVFDPNKNITPLTMISFLKGNIEGDKPPSNKALISKVDWNTQITEKLDKVDESIDILTVELLRIKKEQQSNFDSIYRSLDSISNDLKKLTK